MSTAMRVVALYARLRMKPRSSSVSRAQRRLRRPKGPAEPPAALRKRHDVSARRIDGFACWTVAPRGREATRAAVYLHGGAYVSEIAPQHWTLVGALADAGVRVEVPLYGLAPQHTYREAYPFVTEVYRRLLTEVPASGVTLAGDSAGAGLALGFAQTLHALGLPQPARLVLIAPWLDLTLGNPEIPAVARHDPWLSPVGLIELGRAWAGGDDPADPRLSPVNGPLTGLAPTHVYIGTRDLTHPDVRLLERRATATGAQVTTTVCEGAIHVYPLTPTPEGRAAAAEIVEETAGRST
ncbi:alpha/beta hydrolase fold domain-containing protein [Streptomyces griseoflavus]|uniref:alpha/beta hydrolase fold domain-containing protein n=1 Tax=Streptomyces griseoflavus TaxID=35619 RepID=UPI001E658968|nr:alpha/beta hydrolase fold domain-containing protein [Streptomyces griseoflavus]